MMAVLQTLQQYGPKDTVEWLVFLAQRLSFFTPPFHDSFHCQRLPTTSDLSFANRTSDLTSMAHHEGRLMAAPHITWASWHRWLYCSICAFYICTALFNHVIHATGLPLKSRQLQNQGNRTSRPTLATASVAPSPMVLPLSVPPTNSNYPTAFPSLPESRIVEVESAFLHQLVVSESRPMSETEEFLYEFIMENYTLSIGLGIGEPFIVSNCTVTSTTPVTVNVDHGNSTYDYGLLVNFKMCYSSRFGYNETLNYPDYLLEFLNSHTEQVTNYLRDVINIESEYIISSGVVVIVDPTAPTPMPSGDESRPSSPPSQVQSYPPSSSPSIAPTEYVPAPRAIGIGSIVAIVLGFLLCSLLAFIFLRKFFNQKQLVERTSEENPREDRAHQNGPNDAVIALPIIETDAHEEELAYPEEATTFNQISPMCQSLTKSSSLNSEQSDSVSLSAMGTTPTVQPNGIPSPTSTDYSVTTSRSKQQSDGGTIFGANLMIRDDSFSSDSDDEILSPQKVSSIHDEFDKYKNQVLEKLRDEVEKSIYNVDGMMSLAMTRIFMEAEGTPLDLSWVGAEDPASIEASCYFEAFDWRKQNETMISCSSERFFEDMLNKIVQIVHHGLIRPNDGARLLHGCASILHMQLIRELPSTTIVIRGLRKTNDLAQGHHFLVDSFGVYGDIVDASISPKNRGFGFVRFAHPQSVAAVMTKYESSEIEIQDVSVSVVPLRDAHRNP
ncbi:hypothetical protein HJC23_008101 [Cyclotella cryptica]|uniref:RRM domain-containing protein n=1 Tax=Cyclotella cryptica TaxID=29204 RepID=A0ABD3PDR0_9STRA